MLSFCTPVANIWQSMAFRLCMSAASAARCVCFLRAIAFAMALLAGAIWLGNVSLRQMSSVTVSLDY